MCAETADQRDTPVAIMEATYTALREHGYANLTIQAIADEFEKSKSLLYYHYDTKDEILLALLEFLLEEYTLEDVIDTSQPPDEQLEAFVEGLLPDTLDTESRAFQKALLELRSQALSEDDYRQQFTRFDQAVAETVVEILENGVEAGVFRDIDVDANAELFVSLINGALMRRMTTNSDSAVPEIRKVIDQHIDSQILVDSDSRRDDET